jgi:predicted phosphate transport protein (TIGR00153 family)
VQEEGATHMLGALFGKGKAFYEMFEKAADNSISAANALHNLFVGMRERPGSVSISEKVREVKDIEHQGDQITHETLEMLNRTFVTPIDREDIHQLITEMDDIVDLIDGAASRIELYDIKTITPEAVSFAVILQKACQILKHSVTTMRNITNCREILKHCVEIHTLENEGDQLMHQAMVNLFKTNDAILVIKWKEIYQDLEAATDCCEDVANIIEGIVMKYA